MSISIGDPVVGSYTGGVYSNILFTDPSGNLHQASANGRLSWRETGGIGSLYVGPDACSLDSSGSLTITAQIPDGTPIQVYAHASQTGNLIELHDDPGNILSRFDKAGYFMTRKNSGPANTDLEPGELAIWFDKTNGATKMMLKGKNANGTVLTGSVPLS